MTSSLATLPRPAKPLLTIRPPGRWARLSLREVWLYRDLLLTFAQRDVKVRYKQTALGVIWVILQPLLAAAIFVFVFGLIAGMPSEGVPYIVFSYAGLLAWNAFNGTLTRASASVVDNARLVSKVYFPRLMLPLSTVGTTLVDFAVAGTLLVAMLAWYRINPGWPVLLIPFWITILLVGAIGLGLWTSALMVSYRDLQYALPPFLQLMLYASPVGYSASSLEKLSPKVRTIYFLNPLSSLIEGFRWSVLGTGSIHWGWVLYSVVFFGGVLSIGLVAFKRMERQFADVI
jgi:homopolymeric O-antigen transport system permease protein